MVERLVAGRTVERLVAGRTVERLVADSTVGGFRRLREEQLIELDMNRSEYLHRYHSKGRRPAQ